MGWSGKPLLLPPHCRVLFKKPHVRGLSVQNIPRYALQFYTDLLRTAHGQLAARPAHVLRPQTRATATDAGGGPRRPLTD